MGRNNDRGSSSNQSRRAPKDTGRRVKKKPCAICKDRIEWVDYKDVNLLRKYMSDRGKIRARRVSGNCAQHQRDIALAIKTARELVLLPYTQRTTTERPGGRGGGRGGREGGGYGGQGGSGGRRGRDEERSLSADATSTAVADDAPREPTVEVIEEVVEVTGTGDGSLTELVVDEVVVDGEG
jgi:small subunit ribosomal protein S18